MPAVWGLLAGRGALPAGHMGAAGGFSTRPGVEGRRRPGWREEVTGTFCLRPTADILRGQPQSGPCSPLAGLAKERGRHCWNIYLRHVHLPKMGLKLSPGMQKEAGVQRWEGTCPGMHSRDMAKPGLEPRIYGILGLRGHSAGSTPEASVRPPPCFTCTACPPPHSTPCCWLWSYICFSFGTARLREVRDSPKVTQPLCGGDTRTILCFLGAPCCPHRAHKCTFGLCSLGPSAAPHCCVT